MKPSQSGPFVFEIVFEQSVPAGTETDGSSLSGRSAVVFVEAAGKLGAVNPGASERAARQDAEELAEGAALQAIQKDLPHGFKPVYSATPLAFPTNFGADPPPCAPTKPVCGCAKRPRYQESCRTSVYARRLA